MLPLLEFEQKAKIFIESVLSRLNATGLSETSLRGLWGEVQEEYSDLDSTRYRRCEAELGFDPDECPESVITDALNLNRQMGDATFSEVAPAYSQELSEAKPLSAKISDITEEPGLDGKPEVSVYDFSGSPSKAPWQKAKELASYLRNKIEIGENPVNDDTLYELLGLQKSEYESWTPANRQPVSIAVPLETERFKFYPRKKHPLPNDLSWRGFSVITYSIAIKGTHGWQAHPENFPTKVSTGFCGRISLSSEKLAILLG